MKKLLTELQDQRTDDHFSYSVVIADNDPERSAKQFVAEYSKEYPLRIVYCHEPQPNIAMARNKSIENADGEFIAFIDDDEFPTSEWLWNLWKTSKDFGVEGVLGPVKPSFDRPTYKTGHPINWEQARTGNVLFKRSILNPEELPFRTQFDSAGEDIDFFRRMMAKNCKFVWSNEAVVQELVPTSRCNRSYLLRRALLRGSNFHKHPTNRLKNAAKSLVAVPCYLAALPVLALLGQHVFIKYFCKFLDHASRLLSYAGISLVTQRHT